MTPIPKLPSKYRESSPREMEMIMKEFEMMKKKGMKSSKIINLNVARQWQTRKENKRWD